MEADIVTTATGSSDFSIFGLFLNADIIVKLVMLLLLAASVWCWAIIFDKAGRLTLLGRKTAKFEHMFWSGQSLEKLYEKIGSNPPDPMAAVFAAGMREWRLGSKGNAAGDSTLRAGMQQRLERVMQVAASRQITRLETGLTILASVGSAAPFIGLFGTVWGVMNSFTAIAETQNTNLAVVAPGIAEALFATAMGLVAAIPASVAYNKFSEDLAHYGERLDGFVSDFSAILSRYMDAQSDGRPANGTTGAGVGSGTAPRMTSNTPRMTGTSGSRRS